MCTHISMGISSRLALKIECPRMPIVAAHSKAVR